MANSSNKTTYYLDWFETGKRNRKVVNSRILLYGNVFMHEARYATMKACNCVADAICTNLPLKATRDKLEHCMRVGSYSHVILGECAAWEHAPNCDYIQELKLRYPRTRFILATAPQNWIHPRRYQADDECRVSNNAYCREMAKELNIPCLDAEQWATEMGLLSAESAGNIKYKLAWSYLKQFRITKVFKALQHKPTPRSVMQTAASLLAQRFSAEMKKIIREGAPVPDILWVNKWQHEGATALIVGDSNTRGLCRANTYLSDKVDMYATSYPITAPETIEQILEMLHPRITHVCFSVGAHFLKWSNRPDFEDRLRSVLELLRQNNRKVMLQTLGLWADQKDLTQPDVANNQIIQQLNVRTMAVARELNLEVIDIQSMMSGIPHTDCVHFIKSGYNKPASMIAEWMQGNNPSQTH